MEPIDLTVTRLREIRDEIRETNRRLEETQQHLDQTRDELGRHLVESEIRTATAITALAGAIQDFKSLRATRPA